MKVLRAVSVGIFPAMLAAIAAADDITLRDMGSFHVGGREIAISGKPVSEVRRTPGGPLTKIDPNGEYQVEQMYVQYFLPARKRGAYPLLLWHGGGLSGVSYETTPDGRPGWLNYFIRGGWDTYISDSAERGRAGWAPPEVFYGDPIFLTKADPFERFRIGAGAGSYDKDPARRKVLPGNQFPVDGYDNFARQWVPRWLSTDDQINAAYLSLVDKVCPCVILVHSQAGQWGYKAAQLRPDKVKALVVVEPAAVGDADKVAALKNTPILVMWGDYVAENPRWSTIRGNEAKFTQAIEAAGGAVKVIDLPKAGLRGNSHMIMMDRNNMAVAALIQQWLVERGLYQ
jgi:pimeloyl-ACP methyl ester carboxylesterase